MSTHIEAMEPRRLFATNLLSNGSFENPAIGFGASGQGYTDFSVGQTIGSGWKVAAASVDVVSDKPGSTFASTAASGHQWLDLAGASPGTISQSVTTAANHQYELSFAWTSNPFPGFGSPDVKTMKVTFGGKTVATLSKSVTGETAAKPGWQTSTYLVTASSASSAVSFINTTAGAAGMALDNVTLTAVSFGTGAIGGQVFADGNGDGQKGTDAIGLPGWKVYLDLNANGVLDSADRVTTTDHLGNYSFTNLGAGTYTVRIVAQSGWKTTTAASVVVPVTSTVVKNKLFGEQPI